MLSFQLKTVSGYLIIIVTLFGNQGLTHTGLRKKNTRTHNLFYNIIIKMCFFQVLSGLRGIYCAVCVSVPVWGTPGSTVPWTLGPSQTDTLSETRVCSRSLLQHRCQSYQTHRTLQRVEQERRNSITMNNIKYPVCTKYKNYIYIKYWQREIIIIILQ